MSHPRIAIYPGSFDPPTLGHLDLIERAALQFDRVIVAIGHNASKTTPFLTVDERIDGLQRSCLTIPNVTITSFQGLLVDFARAQGAQIILRGLRATSDFEYEFQIAMANRRLAPDIETVLLMTTWDHSYLSSSVVREVASLGGDFRSFVHPEIVPIIERHLKKSGTKTEDRSSLSS